MLDLNYYLPCRLQQKTIAIIGLGRTTHGDFLSSEDVELLESMASYIGIAIQNARLYASLEEKISEYERLKEFNENIVESINVGVFAVDLEERVESWNAQMEVMYAMSRQEAVGQYLRDILPAGFVAEFLRLKDEPGVHNLYRFRLQTRSGETRCANVAIAPLVSRNFAVVGRIIIVDDITERMELEAQLAQADKLSSIGLLAAGVAHEVNTPLAVISSYTQMLAKQVRGDQRVAPLLDKITQQTFRASEIVNGLLNFSRTGAAEFTALDLNHIIEDTLKLLEHQFRASQVRLETSLEHNLPAVLGNSGKLQQVFQPVSERQGRHGGGRHAACRHPGERPCGGRRLRHRLRHSVGTHAAHLRPILHHQSDSDRRAAARYRAWTGSKLRHYPGACRQDPGRKPGWKRNHLPSGIPDGKEARACLS